MYQQHPYLPIHVVFLMQFAKSDNATHIQKERHPYIRIHFSTGDILPYYSLFFLPSWWEYGATVQGNFVLSLFFLTSWWERHKWNNKTVLVLWLSIDVIVSHTHFFIYLDLLLPGTMQIWLYYLKHYAQDCPHQKIL